MAFDSDRRDEKRDEVLRDLRTLKSSEAKALVFIIDDLETNRRHTTELYEEFVGNKALGRRGIIKRISNLEVAATIMGVILVINVGSVLGWETVISIIKAFK